jgi:hypothetical protein
VSRWYRLPEPREPLEWEMLRALARPSNPEAARALLANLCNVCGHALGWWLGGGPGPGGCPPDVAACVNIHCSVGVNNGRALRNGHLPEPTYFHGDADAVLAAIIDYKIQHPAPVELMWYDPGRDLIYRPHAVIRDLKDPDLGGAE